MKRILNAILATAALLISHQPVSASEDVGVVAANPSPSPDASQVVFSADFSSPSSLMRLWISNANGTGLRTLATDLASKSDEDPSWAPSGGVIAFTLFDGKVANIWTIRPDGSMLTQLTRGALNNRQPSWSPDGKKIVFVSDRGGTNDVWIMNADGTGQSRLTTFGGEENHPSFSSDGASIVFSQSLKDLANLMIMKSDGTGLRNLTNLAARDWNPAWGTKGIVFSSNRDSTSEHWKIWTIQPDGTGLAKLGDIIATDPVWTADGRILFGDELSGTGGLSVISAYSPASASKTVVVNQAGFMIGVGIRPFTGAANVNPNSSGKLRVAILSSLTFDATKAVDRSTLRFGRTGGEASLWKCYDGKFDVNRDGLSDLVCKFYINRASIRSGDTQVILRFRDADGVLYQGSAGVTVVGFDDPDDLNSN